MRKGTLNKEELNKLLRHAEYENNIKDRLIVGLLTSMNLRLKELIILKTSNLTLENEKGKFAINSIKIDRKGKTITLGVNKELESIMKEYLTFRSYKQLPHDYLLFSERNEPFTRSGVYRRIKKILIEIGLEKASLRSIKYIE